MCSLEDAKEAVVEAWVAVGRGDGDSSDRDLKADAALAPLALIKQEADVLGLGEARGEAEAEPDILSVAADIPDNPSCEVLDAGSELPMLMTPLSSP